MLVRFILHHDDDWFSLAIYNTDEIYIFIGKLKLKEEAELYLCLQVGPNQQSVFSHNFFGDGALNDISLFFGGFLNATNKFDWILLRIMSNFICLLTK